jgi:hypothetical protein
METQTRTQPVVGNGAHISNGVDTHSVTIVSVSADGKTVVVQRDDVKPAEGAKPYSNDWEITPNPNNPTAGFTLRKNGQYVQAGDKMNSWAVLRLSGRRYYHCYEF